MKELIKEIRRASGLSQLELAERIGVQFATINRWENEHTIPNSLAQERLFRFCEEQNIKAYDIVIQKIQNIIDDIKIDNNRVLLYHGSKSGIKESIKPVSRATCDFGSGFYMGTLLDQPLTIICDFDDAKLYIVSIDLNDLEIINLKDDLEWGMIVAYNRKKIDSIKDTKLFNRYKNMTLNKDIVYGSIADDRMYYVLDNFFLGNITDVQLVECLKALDLGKQYVAITDKACKKIKIEKEIALSYFEKLILRKKSDENRIKGIEYAIEITKKYRRVGRYFDEILAEGGDNK